MPVIWNYIRDVLDEALQVAPEDRSRYLDRACTDPELRRQIDSLILSYDKAPEFLEIPPLDETSGAWDEMEPAKAWIGRRMGPYRIEEEIGEGGMGAVFRAVRADDEYQKQVAVKLVKGGFGSGFALARFISERQILANLEHPNIARLLDGGRTEQGVPYLVMEYVDGVPIDEYCDAHKLSVTQRLELFRVVCGAVQFAHQNLVIHRDLKPANILVTGDGVPKLLDFGIARLLNTDLPSSEREQTAGFLRILTPEYASPEQVRGDPVNTATDVYSLGVLLYLLLSGNRPYQLSDRSPQGLLEAICNTDPAKPSDAVGRPEAIGAPSDSITPESVSSARGERPDKLRRRLAGDLDNIVLMALRKEPHRRYSSVEQLSADIGRHLDGLPVLAREDTFFYRGSKFVRRHKLALAVSAVFLITVLGGMAATMREAQIARIERTKAERRFNDVRKLANSLIFEVHDSIKDLPGATPARKVIVDKALQYLDSLAKDAGTDLSLQRELAWAYQRVGLVQGDRFAGSLGDSQGALRSIRKAADIWAAIAKTNGATLEDQINNAYGHRVLSNMIAGAAEPGAIGPAREAVAISERLFRIAPTHPRVRRELARDYESLASHEEWAGNYAASLECLRKAFELQKVALQAKPNNPELLWGYADLSVKMGRELAALGSRQEGLRLNRQGVDIYKSLAKDQTDAGIQRELVAVLNEQGSILLLDGQPTAALRVFRQCLAMSRALAAADPQNTVLQHDIGGELEDVGRSLLMAGSAREGLSLLEQAERFFEQESLGPAADPTAVLASRIAVGEALARNGRDREAVEKFRAALSTAEQINARMQVNQTDAPAVHLEIASALSHAGDRAEASEEYQRAIKMAQPLAQAGNEQARYTVADAYSGLADLTLRGATNDRFAQAEYLSGQSVEVWKTIHNPGALSPGGFSTAGPLKATRTLEACKTRMASLAAAIPNRQN